MCFYLIWVPEKDFHEIQLNLDIWIDTYCEEVFFNKRLKARAGQLRWQGVRFVTIDFNGLWIVHL